MGNYDSLVMEKYQYLLTSFKEDKNISAIQEKIDSGSGTYADASKLSSLSGKKTGKLIADTLIENAVDGAADPDLTGTLFHHTMKANYDFVSNAAERVQTILNKRAGIGLKAIIPEQNLNRVSGLVKETESKENIRQFSPVLKQQVENASMSIVDDSVRINADFQYKCGLSPKIVRTADAKCCEWCDKLAGTYSYPCERDVYRRHENCRCVVEFDPGSGKVQNAHTKRTYNKKRSVFQNVRSVEAAKASAETILKNVSQKIAEKEAHAKMLKLSTDGNTFAVKTSKLYRNAQHIKPIKGYTDIVSHGSQFGIVFENEDGIQSSVGAEEFARILEIGGSYKGGDIRLIACSTGKGDAIVPQYLANHFGVNVLAPTDDVFVFQDGEMIISDSEENAILGIETGRWKLFRPQT